MHVLAYRKLLSSKVELVLGLGVKRVSFEQ